MTGSNQQEPFQRISAEQAKEMIDRGDVQPIDVRRRYEWAQAHIREAILIPVDDLFGRVDEVSEDQPVIFHCAMGVRSALACEMAAAMGLGSDRLYNIEAGTGDWIAAGHPTSVGDEA